MNKRLDIKKEISLAVCLLEGAEQFYPKMYTKDVIAMLKRLEGKI